jgi:hypothetical protein
MDDFEFSNQTLVDELKRESTASAPQPAGEPQPSRSDLLIAWATLWFFVTIAAAAGIRSDFVLFIAAGAGIYLANTTLLGLWIAFGSGSFVLRCAASTVATLVGVLIAEPRYFEPDLDFSQNVLGLLLSLAATTAAPLDISRRLGLLSLRHIDESPSSNSRGLRRTQVDLRTVLLWMTMCCIAAAAVQAFKPGWDFFLVLGTTVPQGVGISCLILGTGANIRFIGGALCGLSEAIGLVAVGPLFLLFAPIHGVPLVLALVLLRWFGFRLRPTDNRA